MNTYSYLDYMQKPHNYQYHPVFGGICDDIGGIHQKKH